MEKLITNFKTKVWTEVWNTVVGTFIQIETTRNLVDLTLGSFFIIMIYRVTKDFSPTIIGLICYYAGILVGYIVANIAFNYVGYVKVVKLSFLLQVIVMLVAIVNYDNLISIIFGFSFFYGLGNGIFYNSRNLFELEVLTADKRQAIYMVLEGLSNILGTILPVLTGLLIVDNGYRGTFIIAAVVYLMGLLIPSVKLADHDRFQWREFFLMTKLKGFWLFVVVTVVSSYISELRGYAFMLGPFLILGKNEFNVGILVGAVSLSAGFIAVFARKAKNVGKYANWAAWFLFFPANILFGALWNPVTVTFRSLIAPLGTIFYNPRMRAADIGNMQTLLGHHLVEDGVELQFFNEILLFTGRTLSGLTFILVIQAGIDFETWARIVIIVFAAWPILSIASTLWLQERLKILKQQP